MYFREELGGEIPSSIEIHSPDLGSRVRINIPAYDAINGGPGYKTITRESVIDACRESLCSTPDWEAIIENQLENGGKLGLCWRRESRLDWIWLDDDIDERPRDWAVLYNVGFRQVGNFSVAIKHLGLMFPTL